MDSWANLNGLKAGVIYSSKETRRLLRQKSNAVQLFRVAKKLKSSEAGVTLIETLVALALLGLIAVTFLSGLATTAKATLIADERATAESLARSQIEYVKNQDYIDYAVLDHGEYEVIATPTGSNYSVEINAARIDEDTGQAQGIQKITVTVKRGDKTVLTVDAYKVDR